METSEDAISKHLLEIENIRRELDGYINLLGSLQNTEESIAVSMAGIPDIKKSESALIPYSHDIFLVGKITDEDNALVNIGSGVLKKMSINDVGKKLEKDMKEVQDTISQIVSIIQNLQTKGKRIEEEINKLYEDYKNKLQ
ncbi:hypothetical protein M1293_03450 [Candidatus Parvarchaeota archaeon]|nr:hypothetical protein [Candidatus Parvarchaeota archaeon]